MDAPYNGPDDSRSSIIDTEGSGYARPLGPSTGNMYSQQWGSNDIGDDSAISLRDYIGVVIRRKWVALAAFVVIISISIAYTYTATPVYRSVATLEFEQKKPKQEDRVYGSPDYDQYKGYLATQLEILKSRSLAKGLVAKMNLSNSPEFMSSNGRIGRLRSALLLWFRISDPHANAKNAAPSVNRVANAVLARVSVKPIKTSNLASVSMDAKSPAVAQEMLGNYLDLYLETNLKERRKESLEASAWLKEELAKVQKKLLEAQAELVGFLIDNGIVDSPTETGVSPVMDLLAKTMEAHTKSREARLRMQALDGQKFKDQGAVLPKDVNTEYIGKLKEQLASFELEYTQMKGLYSSDYPQVEILRQKINYLQDRIRKIEKNVLDSALDTAKREENLFKGSVASAKDEANRVKALDAQHMLLKKNVETNEEFYKIILREYKENDIKARTISNNARIIDTPTEPEAPSWPKKKLFLLVGCLMGLAGGVAAAFMVERLDNTIQTPEEIERDFNVRRLAIVPDLDYLPKSQSRELGNIPYEFVAHRQPKSPMSDAIQNIHTSISLSNADKPVRCMVVSSPNPAQGKTLISISIASVMCSGQKKVVIVDADMRKPRVHQVFGHREPGPGLSTLLGSFGRQVPRAVHAHSIKGLFYITAGPPVDDHLRLLRSDRMKRLIDQLRRAFHYIVFDSPPILGFSDVPTLCTHADGLIMVAKQGHLGRNALREALNATSSVNGCEILGVVLNKAHASADYGFPYFGYNRDYYYGNYRYYGDRSR
ncbi:MAG: polysaccharide biosynthesis tyrosine autokinase [Desulfomonilaceae bacterium]